MYLPFLPTSNHKLGLFFRIRFIGFCTIGNNGIKTTEDANCQSRQPRIYHDNSKRTILISGKDLGKKHQSRRSYSPKDIHCKFPDSFHDGSSLNLRLLSLRILVFCTRDLPVKGRSCCLLVGCDPQATNAKGQQCAEDLPTDKADLYTE